MLEFRLYYDENGEILFYTCEKPEGNYVIINAQTYAECRIDIKIIDGKIVKTNQGSLISKLVPSTIGIKCASNDINIITEDIDNVITWNVKRYEHRYN